MSTRYCDECGESYQYKRVTSKYCSDACRIAAYRKQTVDEAGNETIPVLYLENVVPEVRTMRIKARPLDIEVEWTLTNGKSFKQWFEFAENARFETIYQHGRWDWSGLRYLISSRDRNG